MGKTLILTCEHATNHVPAKYRHWFHECQHVLETHRGWDPGTKDLGQRLKRRFKVPLVTAQVSRLLIELNRSLSHPKLFSEYIAGLSVEHKQDLIQRYYLPYRKEVENLIRSAIQPTQAVLHVSLHSFTGVLAGVPRTADIGILYDPQRAGERTWCQLWKQQLQRKLPTMRIRKNYPYLGKADGLTTSLRKKFSAHEYIGVELEINQNHVANKRNWNLICQVVAETLEELVAETSR